MGHEHARQTQKMWPAGPLSAECVGNHGHLARLGQEHQEDHEFIGADASGRSPSIASRHAVCPSKPTPPGFARIAYALRPETRDREV